jgi:branched-chain amino acid transport system substrate-binding protein
MLVPSSLRGRALRFTLAAALLGAVAALASSCSILIDDGTNQCAAQADCAPFPGTLCQGGLCTTCATTNDCVASYGENNICQKDTHLCVSLLSPDCTEVFGDYTNDDAIILGAIAPFPGDDTSTGVALIDAMNLALADLDQVNDLPPAPGSSGQRPIVVVACSDQSDSDTGQAAAQHLVDDVKVPAIIGPAFSGVTLDVAQNITIPAGVLLFSPSATSTEITGLPDHGLVWRTSPSDVYQAAALKKYVPDIEANVRAALGLAASDKVKLAVLHKGDSYGSGLNTALLSGTPLQLNGASVESASNASSFLQKDYGDPSHADTDPPIYAQTVTAALGLQPHIILVFGTEEGIEDVFEPIDMQWPSTLPYKPIWVFSDGGETSELRAYVGNNTELRQRVRGTVPGTNNQNFVTFRGHFIDESHDDASPDVFGTAGMYDITYLLAYSIVALGSQPITGANLNGALQVDFTAASPTVNVSKDITSTFTRMQKMQPFNFEGASGSLQFDPTTGEAPSDIQIWCLPDDVNTAGSNSGLFYSADADALSGSIMSAICGFTE